MFSLKTFCCLLVYATWPAYSQTAECGLAHPALCLKDAAQDQAGIWTSPLRIKPHDIAWLVPLAGATALAMHYDLRTMNALGYPKGLVNASNRVSDFGSPYATAGASAGLYFLGLGIHNKRLTETGRLAEEAVVDAALVGGALKLATNRQPVGTGDGQGGFWPHGTSSYVVNSSFPAGHAIVTWAIASVVASEYHSKPVKIAAYTFATAISLARVTARAHFPSDVVVGSSFGYLIGHYVTRHHARERPNTP